MIRHKLIKMMVAVGLILATTVTTAFAATYGWEQKGNDWYYKGYDGTYVTGTVPIDNMAYKFDETGKMMDSWDRLKMNKNEKTIGVGVTTVSPSQSVRNEPTIVNTNNKVAVGQVTTENIVQLSENEFYTDVCKESFRLINEHRKVNNIVELDWSDDLNNSSKIKSEHMVSNQYFSHDWKGIKFGDLSEQLSGTHPNGENCAGSYQYNSNNLNEESATLLANDLFNRWKASAEHNANMLNSSYTKFGFGYAYGNYQGLNMIYGTQQFQR